MEHIYKPGDVCLDCLALGISRELRLFFINLSEQIVKCESNECMFPYTDEVSSDSEDEDVNDNVENVNEYVDAPNVVGQLHSMPDLNVLGCSSTSPPKVRETSLEMPAINIDFSSMDLPAKKHKKADNGVSKNPSELKSVVPTKPSTEVKKKSRPPVVAGSSRTPLVEDSPTTPVVGDPSKVHISRFLDALKVFEGKKSPKKRRPKQRLPSKMKSPPVASAEQGGNDDVAAEVKRLLHQRRNET